MFHSSKSQSALSALHVYISASNSPERLRLRDSGEVEIAGRFEILFDRFTDQIKSLVMSGYKPTDWKSRAQSAVIEKLDRSYAGLVHGDDGEYLQAEIRAKYINTLLTDISLEITRSADRSITLTPQEALKVALAKHKTSDADVMLSNATYLLIDISRLGHRAIENKVQAAIGRENINFLHITDQERTKLISLFEQSIAEHLKSAYSWSEKSSEFGAAALMVAIERYHVDLTSAMTLLNLPSALTDLKADWAAAKSRDRKIQALIVDGVAHAIAQQDGITDEAARRIAPKIKYLMDRYQLDCEQSLDLHRLTNQIASRLPSLGTDKSEIQFNADGKVVLSAPNIDKARGIQQIMQRSTCTVEQAMEIVERRARALSALKGIFPENVSPTIVAELPRRFRSTISDESKQYLGEQIRNLKDEPQSSWRVPGTITEIPVSAQYIEDCTRNLHIELDDGNSVRSFDEDNSGELTEAIYAFANDPKIMLAMTNSFCQTIMGSILSIVFAKELKPSGQPTLMLSPGTDKTARHRKFTLHRATLDGQGNLIIRHIHMEKSGMIMDAQTGKLWPVNQGKAWHGDINRFNAAITCDFSYAFKLSELKEGLRNPEILNCSYETAIELDWDEIDQTLLN